MTTINLDTNLAETAINTAVLLEYLKNICTRATRPYADAFHDLVHARQALLRAQLSGFSAHDSGLELVESN